MKDASSVHQKIQNLCDCFTANDPLKEMSEIKKETDLEEAAQKWLALAVLHGINSNASKISITTTGDGDGKVTAEYRTAELPSPGGSIAEKVINTVRSITHIEEISGDSPLAFGIRNNSMDLNVTATHEGGREKITISFP
ncbi:MAG: hypothetical protein ACN4GW_20500 [Desulforhopalus sp.]